MKRDTLLYVVLGIAAYMYWMRRKKQGKPLLPSQVTEAASSARTMVADAIDKTTFTPDLTTFKDLYKQDINHCK